MTNEDFFSILFRSLTGYETPEGRSQLFDKATGSGYQIYHSYIQGYERWKS